MIGKAWGNYSITSWQNRIEVCPFLSDRSSRTTKHTVLAPVPALFAQLHHMTREMRRRDASQNACP